MKRNAQSEPEDEPPSSSVGSREVLEWGTSIEGCSSSSSRDFYNFQEHDLSYDPSYDFANPAVQLIANCGEAPQAAGDDIVTPEGSGDSSSMKRKRRRTSYREPMRLAQLTAAVEVLRDRSKDGPPLGMKVVAQEYGIPYNTLRDNYLK